MSENKKDDFKALMAGISNGYKEEQEEDEQEYLESQYTDEDDTIVEETDTTYNDMYDDAYDAPAPDIVKICPYCGSANPVNAVFCLQCGNEFRNSQAQAIYNQFQASQRYNEEYETRQDNVTYGNNPGSGDATGSLICGIIGCILLFTGYGSIISIILGIIGIILSSTAKSHGYVGGVRTGGFVMSLIALIIGGMVWFPLIACSACALTCAS